MLTIDAANLMTIPAGDALELRYQELDEAGAPVSLASAQVYLVISSAGGTTVPGGQVLGTWDAGEQVLAWSVPGTVTAALRGVTDLNWELRATGAAGLDQWERGRFRVASAASVSGAPGSAPVGQGLITARQVAGGWRIVVSHRGARGLSAAEQLHGAGIIPQPTAQALDTYLRALCTAAANP